MLKLRLKEELRMASSPSLTCLWALVTCSAAASTMPAAVNAHANPPHDVFRRLEGRDVKVAGKLRTTEQRRLRSVLNEKYPAAVAALDSGELWGGRFSSYRYFSDRGSPPESFIRCTL